MGNELSFIREIHTRGDREETSLPDNDVIQGTQEEMQEQSAETNSNCSQDSVVLVETAVEVISVSSDDEKSDVVVAPGFRHYCYKLNSDEDTPHVCFCALLYEN